MHLVKMMLDKYSHRSFESNSALPVYEDHER